MIGAVSFGQIPQGVNYQAVAYDSNGLELVNQEISVRLGILLETTAAETSYTETHQVSTNDFGLFSLVISGGNTTDDFSTLNWENGAFLKVELDANLDGNYILMGINSFSSVPYSLFAENIPTAVSNEIDSLRNIVEMVSQYFGCKDHDACNYNAEATMSDNSCTYALEGYTCDSICIDTDMDGVCDLDEVEGCTDAQACNYIVGLVKGVDGKEYFVVKNSWGDERGLEDYKGHVLVSEAYFKLNTISVMFHKDAFIRSRQKTNK